MGISKATGMTVVKYCSGALALKKIDDEDLLDFF